MGDKLSGVRVETLHAPHGTELEPVGGRVRLSVVGELAVWIEFERPKWFLRGVDVLEDAGRTVFAWMEASGDVDLVVVWVGTIADCLRRPMVADRFVFLKLLGDGMSVEDAKVLIENAVEQVAGR